MRMILAILLGAGPAPADPQAAVTYESAVQKLMAKQCRECHGPKSPTMEEYAKDWKAFQKRKLGPRMDSYEGVMYFVNGPDAGALMRQLDDGGGRDGKAGDMYEHLGETPAERAANLRIFKSWIGGWTLKEGAQMTEADRKAILARRR